MFTDRRQVPEIVTGIVIIAAGTSVPDAVSSVLVAQEGKGKFSSYVPSLVSSILTLPSVCIVCWEAGDMAVANVLGSNVFNIFLGLGLPWTINGLRFPSSGTEVC